MTEAMGMLRTATGCQQGTPWPAEFWVQSERWGQRACSQHVAGVIRRAVQEGARAALVYGDTGSECYVAGDTSIPADPMTGVAA
jgi:hypothetical protein